LPSLLYFQIIIDVIFFVVILLLLRQLNRRMARKPEADGATVVELKKLMTDSQNSTDLFLRTVQESEERLNKLARQLDSREKRIVILIEKAESAIQQLVSQQAKAESAGSSGEKYAQIVRFVRQGLSREDVSKQLGITMGEIDLVVELERAREAVHQKDLSE
jgi:arsenate reductase-like glutaredoxin family protein